MKTQILKAIDFYTKYALFFDFLIIGMLMYLVRRYQIDFLLPKQRSEVENLMSNVVSTIVSLTGFILTALTIIVSVKANIKIKSLEEAANGMELLLSTKNYKLIVFVFRNAIIELITWLAILYVGWWPLFNLSVFVISILIAGAICAIIFATVRTLAVLFEIIFLEFPR
jgi:hypothetical protein